MTDAAKSANGADNAEIVAVIVGAITAMGYSENQIASIKPIISRNWRLDGRLRSRI